LALSAKKQDINNFGNTRVRLFFEFSSSLLLEYGRDSHLSYPNTWYG